MPHPAAAPASEVLVGHPLPLMAAGIAATLAGDFRVRRLPAGQAESLLPLRPTADGVFVTDHAAGLRVAAAASHGWRVLVVDQDTRAWNVRTALQAGIHGYVSADCSQAELLQAAAAVRRGRRHLCPVASAGIAESVVQTALTPREMDVLQLLAAGLDNKTISLRLDIALGTVKAHVKSVLAKLSASSRTHAVAAAHARGLVPAAPLKPR